MDYRQIFENNRTIAVVGMSQNTVKPAHWVPMYMLDHGYIIYPVNPLIDNIAGMKSYPSLMDVPASIDIVNVFRRSEDCLPVVQQAVERKNKNGDVKIIWLQQGIINDEAKKLAEDNGILFIQDECIYKEHARL